MVNANPGTFLRTFREAMMENASYEEPCGELVPPSDRPRVSSN